MKMHARLAMLFAACWMALLTAQAWAVPDADLEKMRQAAPDKPQVQPKKQRRLLVISTTKGFRHSSIGHGVAALRIMGEKTGAYTIEHTEDVNALNADNLKRFDAICFLNTTGDLFDDPALRKSLADFVKEGKGLVGIHSATDTFYSWAEYGEMMGGYFDGHPWHEKVTLKIEDTTHPCNACFEGKNRFEIVDEIYQFKPEPYSRTKLRILTSLDTNLTNMTHQGIKRTDGDFGVSWLRSYGKGRVFYCSLGHREEIYWNPTVLRHYLAGIQFAFGDLEADTTPSAEYDRTALAKRAEALLPAVMAYDFDKDRAPLVEYTSLVSAALGYEPARAAIEKQLLSVVQSNASLAAKQFACRQLWVIGSEASAPVLAKLLNDEKLADLARYALERNPSDAAATVLRQAMGSATGRTLVGLINSLGERRDAASVQAIAQRLNDSDATIRTAAIAALGKIGGTQAVAALRNLPQTEPAVLDALVQCADQLAEAGDTAAAIAIYRPIYANTQSPRANRIAALRGLLLAQPAAHIDELARLLTGEDAHLAAVAAGFISQLPGESIGTTFAQKLTSLPPATQALVITALAQRNDAKLAPTFINALSSNDASVRLAAIRALGQLEGSEQSVEAVLKIATSRSGADRNAARESLDYMKGQAVDAKLLAVARSGEPTWRIEAMRSLAARRVNQAVPVLVEALRLDNSDVRISALDALNTLGTPQQYEAVVEVLVKTTDRGERRSAERTTLTLARQMDRSAATKPLINAMSNASVEARGSILNALSRLGGDEALAAVRNATTADNEEVRTAAIRALAEWPDTSAMNDLLVIAKQTTNPTHRTLALRGFLNALEKPSNRTSDATMVLYRQAAELAKRDDEKKLVIAGLANQVDEEALRLVKAYQSDPAVKAEADQAAARISAALAGPPVVSASHNNQNAKNAVDGKPETRWDTAQTMKPGMWFAFDLKAVKRLDSIVLDTRGSAQDFPRGYEVYVSDTPEFGNKPVVTGQGTGAVVEIKFPQGTRGRYIRIVQTGSSDSWYWSIHEAKVNAE